MNSVIVVSLLAAAGLAVVHLLSGKLRFFEVTPRSIWLSMAGGVSVAYVFIHLLPELAEGQESISMSSKRSCLRSARAGFGPWRSVRPCTPPSCWQCECARTSRSEQRAIKGIANTDTKG